MQNPLTIIIFGATGDLYQGKLANALFDLFSALSLPAEIRILGFGRRPLGDEGFKALTREAIIANKTKNNKQYDESKLSEFLDRVVYVEGNLENREDFHKLSEQMTAQDTQTGVCSKKLYYLAVPPNMYEVILGNISSAGLTVPCAPGVEAGEKDSWTRVLVEKPFGEDLERAESLDKLLGELFDETQIFRIDHYLAKETMQNILNFRFEDSPQESKWNNQYIEKVKIFFYETNTLGRRGAFYEGVGALRDVGQNHMLQMLALVSMEKPAQMSSRAIQNSRAQVLEQAMLFPNSEIVRAQYEGYTEEEKVAADSDTETFFKLTLAVENQRWQGVPFELESGKALDKAEVGIRVYFKDGSGPIDFMVSSSVGVKHDAYEKVFLDSIIGDQTVFTSTREVLAEWKLVTDILNSWQDSPLLIYKKGSNVEDIK